MVVSDDAQNGTAEVSTEYRYLDKYLSFVVGTDVICANADNQVVHPPSRCPPNRCSMSPKNFRCSLTSHLKDWL